MTQHTVRSPERLTYLLTERNADGSLFVHPDASDDPRSRFELGFVASAAEHMESQAIGTHVESPWGRQARLSIRKRFELIARPPAERNAYELAHIADCSSPDTQGSPGAKFLQRVADAVAEAGTYGRHLADDRQEVAWEIADSSVPVYTYERWQVFTDLAAYQENVRELGATSDDLTGAAGIALYMIAERLALALLAEIGDDTTAPVN